MVEKEMPWAASLMFMKMMVQIIMSKLINICDKSSPD